MTIERRAAARDKFLAALRRLPGSWAFSTSRRIRFPTADGISTPRPPSRALSAMVAEGAAIIDVGGESTRPGHASVSAEEELRRVAPVLEALAEDFDAAVSIDTSKAAVAREAARLGACVINDIWGLQRDPGMADAVADTGSAVVVMHNRERADGTIDILDDVERFFERSLNLAAGAGVAVRPHSARSRHRLRQDAGAEPFLHLEPRPLPPLRRADPRRAFAQVVHRQDHRRRGRQPSPRHARRRHDCAHARRFGARVHDVAENRAALDIFKTLSAAAPAHTESAQGRRPGADRARARRQCRRQGRKPAPRAPRASPASRGSSSPRVSRLYRTAPWGKTDQDWFVNACALGLTRLAPEALLERMKALEVDLGRVSTERWGPRVIDIDLIAYDDVSLKSERLTLPHPELFNRAFVLVPLAEIAPDLVIAGVGWATRRAARARGRRVVAARLSGPATAFDSRWPRSSRTPTKRALLTTPPPRRIAAVNPARWIKKPMPAWSQTFTFLDGEWLEGNAPDHRRAHPRLLAGVERVRRRARLRGRDARSRQALRPPQPLGHSPCASSRR